MASRDTHGGGGGGPRGMKILSREERGDADRDRMRRDRRRDRDRGGDRDGRDRRRGGAGGDNESSSRAVQGPIVLLKRPDTKPSTSTAGSGAPSSDRSVEQQRTAASGSGPGGEGSKSGSGRMILQRSAKRDNNEGTPEQQGAEKGKVTGPPPITELLKPAYQFPGGRAMPLIDSNMRICPWKRFDYDGNNYPGNMDYLVITAIGKPSAGKSSILSYLAGNDKFGERKIFPGRTREEEMTSSIFVTKDQLVLIEISSVFNQAAANELIPLVSQHGVLEVANVTWNLRLVRWALSISHVVLIVSENLFEPTVLQLLNSAEIIRPMDSALGEGSYPEPIYVCNKANLELLDKTEMTDQFRRAFTSVTGRTPRIASNYFVLPDAKYECEEIRFKQFKKSLLEFNRYNRAPFALDNPGLGKLSQKHTIQDWFQNASRLWDEMHSSGYFSSYVKLLP